MRHRRLRHLHRSIGTAIVHQHQFASEQLAEVSIKFLQSRPDPRAFVVGWNDNAYLEILGWHLFIVTYRKAMKGMGKGGRDVNSRRLKVAGASRRSQGARLDV